MSLPRSIRQNLEKIINKKKAQYEEMTFKYKKINSLFAVVDNEGKTSYKVTPIITIIYFIVYFKRI